VTILAAALVFLAIWIVLPAPNLWLLPIGVGAPELSPILLAAAVLVLLLSLRGKSVRKLAVLLSLVAAGLAAVPWWQLKAVTRDFDAALEAAFPGPAPSPSAAMRPSPVVMRDLFLGIDTAQPRINRAIQFATPEGFPLVLDIYRPEATGRYPILVQIHGGAWQRGARADDETFARYFANRGYVVIAIEYRLAPRWRWPAQLEDVRAALAWIRERDTSYDGNADRIAIVGRSAGAQLGLLAAYLEKPPVRAVVSYYGPTDLVEGWNDPPRPDPISVRSILETLLAGTPEAAPFRYREASPVTYVSAAVPPTLQIQGARDHVVRPRFARDLHQRLRTAGARSALLEIPWAEHAFDAVPQGLSGQLSLYYTERFLAEALAPRR
jgi:acetyl esterase/lipase